MSAGLNAVMVDVVKPGVTTPSAKAWAIGGGRTPKADSPDR